MNNDIQFESNIVRIIRHILNTALQNEINELADKYDIPPEVLEGIIVNLYVKDNTKTTWKGGKTKFVKAFVEEVIMLIEKDELDWEDLGFLLYLSAKFTNYEDNILRNEDGFYISQKEIINIIHTNKKKNSSKQYISRKLRDLENKKLLFATKNPKNKREKIYYLTPHLFYKGKLIDDNMKNNLLKITKGIKDEIEKRNDIQEEINSEILKQNERDVVGFIFERISTELQLNQLSA